jgi:hypothetical protein
MYGDACLNDLPIVDIPTAARIGLCRADSALAA